MGVRHSRQTWGDIYCGTREALLTAGIAKADWFPAIEQPSEKRPGRVKRSYRISVNGQIVLLRQYAPASDRWEIWMECSKEERERRSADAQAAACRASSPQTSSVSAEQFQQRVAQASAVLSVGTKCYLYSTDEPVTVTNPFELVGVRSENGAYVNPSGDRFDWQWGYIVRTLAGKEFFAPAGDVVANAARHKYSHLRLVADNDTRPVSTGAPSTPKAAV